MNYKDLSPAQKKATEPWILTAADKSAVEAGMWWDLESASYTIWWIERFCRLYEGARAGSPLYLHGYPQQPEPEYIDDFYEDLDLTLEIFAARFEDYYAKRDDPKVVTGWQLDFHARCYGWKQNSARWAREGVPVIRRFKSGSVFVPKKSGKMIDINTPILTPSGFVLNGNLKTGDRVFDSEGLVCEVTLAHPIYTPEVAYEITFSNQEKVKACEDHLWSLFAGDIAPTSQLCVGDRLRNTNVFVDSIESCEPCPMRCITVNSPDSTYLFGHTMLPTHNSPTMAANIVYGACGDGEQGNKVFIGAADLDQAGIAWLHSYNMIMQSPELKHECKPNMSTKRVQHLPTNSFFEPMSSANSRSQNAKEGLNGSICLDEIHVLDSEFVAILEYAGVSRAEPLQLEFSTAGKNPEAYGATRWKYGEAVNAGEEQNLHHLHCSYHAPQNLTAEEMDKDPEKYIRMANPALGHTVDMEELLPSYHAAKGSQYKLRKYMMYRLNIWQNAASSWLDPQIWTACSQPAFTIPVDRPCVIGLDLARRYDLASAVLCFLGDMNDEGIHPVYVKPIFWCAEDIMRERSSKIPEMLDWQAEGHIRATPGNVIDFRTIEHDLREVIEKYNVVGMTYDATYAEDIVQRLTEGVVGPTGDYVYEPLAIGEKSVSQSIMTMTGMTTDMENDLKSGRIIHDGNPVLTWQVGNATLKEDNKGNIQIVKENRNSFRTVDGVVAMIMGRWGLLDCDDFEIKTFDYYLTNDVEFV